MNRALSAVQRLGVTRWAALVAVVSVIASAGRTWAADATWNIATGTSWTTSSAWNPAASPGIQGTNGSTSASLDVATFTSMPSSAVYYTTTSGNDLNVGGISVNTATTGSLGFQSGSTGSGTRRIYFTAGGRGVELSSSVTGTVTFERVGISSGASGTLSFINNATASTAWLRFNSSFVSNAAAASVLELGGVNTGSNSIEGAISAATASLLSLRKTGASYWSLGAANTYAGGTVIESGTLGLGSDAALGTGTVTINGGALGSFSTARVLVNPFVVNSNFTLGGVGQATTLNGTVDLGGSTRTITLGNSATINGVVSNGGLTIVGSTRRFTLGGTNTYALGTQISSGTLIASSTGAFGTGTVTVASGAALDLGSQAVANAITNNGGSILNAASFIGTQTLGGSSAFGALGGVLNVSSGGIATLQALATGTITVNSGGRLLLDSTGTAGGSVTVNAGGFLGGIGRVTGALSVAGTLSPGTSPGALTVDTLALQSTATTLIELAGTTPGSGYDTVTVSQSGGLTYDGALSLSFATTFPDQTTFQVFNFTGSPSGGFASIAATGGYGSLAFAEIGTSGVWEAFPTGGQTLRFTEATGALAVVPEPSAIVLAASALAGLAACRRRRGRRAEPVAGV